MSTAVVSTEQLLQQLHWRYATKKFDSTKTITPDVWQALIESLVLAPSSFGLQPWKFFVVTNPETRQQLLEHSWGQTQVVEASHLVVLAFKKGLNTDDVDRFMQNMADVRQVPIENLQGFAKVINGFMAKPPYPLDIDEWSKRQVYIALGQFMTSAALLGIDTCPMEGFNPPKYDEILGLTEQGYASVVLCPAGYRAEDDKSASQAKVRYPAQQLVQYVS
ncbi:NAD(P)H-dependent oxidoreductase [Leptolyngbya sp. FACHB-321]|uniref:NAD(P)H-dependent oxidoreductase n=1 Tax=Leptolyngbya sp. FACHB-321 TaxID=2692807 RepID=UPI001687BA0C|nr:NAD(P)H-dependent oxidoreductase [Leptolyngbya sp. FACHB-321]MBD2035683.1 NAD(P)H-dependent oxidoreductase [Leptolyngbya sp. FACHB-321]